MFHSVHYTYHYEHQFKAAEHLFYLVLSPRYDSRTTRQCESIADYEKGKEQEVSRTTQRPSRREGGVEIVRTTRILHVANWILMLSCLLFSPISSLPAFPCCRYFMLSLLHDFVSSRRRSSLPPLFLAPDLCYTSFISPFFSLTSFSFTPALYYPF